jgi:hypothetical protein
MRNIVVMPRVKEEKVTVFLQVTGCLQTKRGNPLSHPFWEHGFPREKVRRRWVEKPGGGAVRIPWGYLRGKYGKSVAVLGVFMGEN